MKGDKVGGPIRWRMHIAASPERVFTAINSGEGRASFWAESAVEHSGHIDFRFIDGHVFRGRVLERESPCLLVIEYIGGPVRFELSSDEVGGTNLLLVHEGVDPDEWSEVHAGWLNVLFPLKAYVTYGVDLRDHDSTRSWRDGYADQ